MLTVGIIGAGDFGAQHAKAIAQTPDVKLLAASRTNEQALTEFSDRFDCKGYLNYLDLLDNKNINTVVIATPHHMHTEIVKAAARAKKHILLEKPMAPNLAECDEILKVVKENNVKLMLGHVNHFVPAYLKAKELLESGEMGEVVYGHSIMSKLWMTPNRRNWHLDRDTGGGMWLTIGVHVLDQLCWLIGQPVSSVTADIQTRFHEQEADDIGLALLRFEKGATATANAIGYQTGVSHFSTELTCTKGMLKISHSEGLFIGKNEEWQNIPGTACNTWMDQAMLNEWQAFSEVIQQEKPIPVTGDYARHIMQLAFAAESSSKLKKEIHLK